MPGTLTALAECVRPSTSENATFGGLNHKKEFFKNVLPLLSLADVMVKLIQVAINY